jgi:hypothetical protein
METVWCFYACHCAFSVVWHGWHWQFEGVHCHMTFPDFLVLVAV